MANLPSNLPTILRDAGLKVVEVDGWRGRERPGPFAPVGVLCHHTATRKTASDAAVVRLLRVGRSDLPGPLCQIGLSRNGTVYLIAAGRANHAGRAKSSGTVAAGDGNELYIGIEAFNDGVGEPWPIVQRDAYELLCAVLSVKVTGNSVNTVRGHKETSVTGKIDPTFSMPAFREAVGAEMNRLKNPRTPAPKPEEPAVNWTTPIDKDPRAVVGAVTLQTVTANVKELPRHDDTITTTFDRAASGCQLAGFQETGNKVYINAMQDTLVNHSCSGIAGDPQHNVSIAFDKAMFKRVASGWRKLYDGESGISHTRHALWVEIESLLDPSFHLILLSAHYPSGAFDPSGAPRTSGDRIEKRVEMWNEANIAMVKLLQEQAAKGHPMVLFADINRQKVRALPATIAGRKTHAVANALDWIWYIDGAEVECTTHESNKVDILSDHKALQNRVTFTRF